MTSTQRIPIPTDSYDHSTCDLATLTSIKALITCFDTTMDSFHESIETLIKRLDALTERTTKIQNRIELMQQIENEEKQANEDVVVEEEEVQIDGDQPQKQRTKMKIAKVTYPALYEHATQMKDITSALYRQSSAISLAKERAGDAIKSLLLEELAMNEVDNNVASASTATETSTAAETIMPTSAKPSDEWLDRASAFEERSNCNMAIQVDTVPPLLSENSVKTINSVNTMMNNYSCNYNHNDNGNHNTNNAMFVEEVLYYEKGLEEQEQEDDKASTSTGNNAVIDTSTVQQSTNRSLILDYYDDSMSVMSEFTRGAVGATVGVSEHSTVISSYSTVSQSATSASRRRRQRKVMAMADASSPSMRDKIMKDNTNRKWSSSASSSRQQAFSGSVSYVCDLLHDTYGLVDESSYAHVYPRAENVSNLLVYNDMKCDLAYQQKQQLDTTVVSIPKHPSLQKTKYCKEPQSSTEMKPALFQLTEEVNDE